MNFCAIKAFLGQKYNPVLHAPYSKVPENSFNKVNALRREGCK